MTSHQRVLILGATGCVGRALARVWPADCPAVWQYRPSAERPNGEALAWDILTEPAPPCPGITGIVQLAGGTSAAALAATTPLALAACDLGEQLNVPVLIASSQAVYGPVAGPVSEQTPCAPTNDYGRAKLAMEQAVAGRATCLRIGNVVGCDMLLLNATRGQVTLDQLPDGGSPRRSYVSAQGLGQVMRGLLTQSDRPAVLNVAQPGTIMMHELLAAAGLEWTWRKAGAGVLASLALEVDRLAAMVPLPTADAETLIKAAKAAGWRSA